MRLSDEIKDLESIPLFEKAVEVDPGFAMAHAALSDAHFNLRHQKEYEAHARLAFEYAGRVTDRERHYVEGSYYTLREETFGQGIESYLKAIDLHPDYYDARFNLGWAYRTLERYEDALEQFETLRKRGFVTPGVLLHLYACYTALGELEKAEEVVTQFELLHPDFATAWLLRVSHLTFWGRYDQAQTAYDKADAHQADPYKLKMSQHFLWTLREDWDRAYDVAQELIDSVDPEQRREGLLAHSATRLFEGRSQEAVALLKQANLLSPDPLEDAFSRNYLARIFIEQGQLEQAIEESSQAQRDGKGSSHEWEGLFFTALAQAKMGQLGKAEKTAETLRVMTSTIPTHKEKRRYYHLLGEIALAGGEPVRAIKVLTKAQSMLSARGQAHVSLPPHVRIWYALGTAHLSSGHADQAAQWFERVVESPFERIYWPTAYVRSLYYLGRIHENGGNLEEARAYYQRFYENWRDGDLDRERVEEARRKLSSWHPHRTTS
jgi:tetratricopeptide (TPR) repeat protein